MSTCQSMKAVRVKTSNGALLHSWLIRSIRVAERLALPTSDHGVAGSNPAGGEILLELRRRFIAQSLSCSSFHRLEMTEILLKGRKTLTHLSIMANYIVIAQLISLDSPVNRLWHPVKWFSASCNILHQVIFFFCHFNKHKLCKKN